MTHEGELAIYEVYYYEDGGSRDTAQLQYFLLARP